MRGFIYHRIMAPFGWGRNHNIRNIDVMRVRNMSVNKRLFMIFDRNLPYTLNIEYIDPHDYQYSPRVW